MPGSTITTTLSHGISLGSAAYSSPLTITSTGAVDPTSIAAGETAAVYGDGIVVNDGTILGGSGVGAASLTGISLFGGITNNGLIGGGIYIASYSSITNFGTISGFATNGSGVSVSIDAGGTGETITNFGTIIGGVEMYSGTVINGGTIEGNGGYAIHSVTDFQGFKLVVEPGAVFIGDVIPGSEVQPNVILELAGTSTTALSGIGTSFQNFNKLSFATGAAWTAEGSLGGLEIDGFTFNDTLVLDGFAATSDTYVAGTGLKLSNGTTTQILDLTGSFNTASFAVQAGSNSTTIAMPNSGSTISTTINVGITLGSGGYASPLTITTTGVVSPPRDAQVGQQVYTFSSGLIAIESGSGEGTLINQGSIYGGFGTRAGGAGARFASGTILNAGLIDGGGCGASYDTGGTGVIINGYLANTGTIAGGTGATGVRINGTFNNTGLIQGGEGQSSPPSRYPSTLYANGGAGLYLNGGTGLNSGTIAGGGNENGRGHGGIGVYLQNGATLANSGTVIGGAGGSAAAGIVVLDGTLFNTGTIIGFYPNFANDEVSGYDGVSLMNGTVVNYGKVLGGTGQENGAGVEGGTFINKGVVAADDSSGYGASVSYGLLINDANATIAGTGNIGVYLTSATLVNGGTIAGGVYGHVQQDAVQIGSSSSLLIVDPGAVFIGGVAGAGGSTLDLARGDASTGTLEMGGSFSGFATIAFDPAASWQLAGTTAELAGNETIAGFAAADTLTLENFVATTATYVAGTGLELGIGTVTEKLDIVGSFSTASFLITDTTAGTEITLETPICYLRGTRILTPAGEIPIEALAIGDTVISRYNGYRRVKWIGRQSYAARFVKNNCDQLPVRIAAGALGPNQPKRDLSISPGHSMLLGGVLVLARDLVNGVTITQNDCPDEIHYYQIEFESHDCVLAEGSWSESFCDYAGLRNQFHNAQDFHRLYPDHVTPETHNMCAPRPEAGPALAAALRPIAARAAARVKPGPLQGWIDIVETSGTIAGWAQDTANPQLPVLLEIVLDGRVLGTVLACDHRPDLAAAGIGNGKAGFTFTAAVKLSARACRALTIRRAADHAELSAAPHCLALNQPRQRKRA